jgi:hypothetical protein
MRSIIIASIALLAEVVAPVLAGVPNPMIQRRGLAPRAAKNPNSVGHGTFDQPIDHYNPSKGTFKQRFWWNADYWAGPGSPVFVLNAGESNASHATGYLEPTALPGYYAKTFKGAVILLERKFPPLYSLEARHASWEPALNMAFPF